MGAVRMGSMLLGDLCQILGLSVSRTRVGAIRTMGGSGWCRPVVKPELRNMYLLVISGLGMGGCWQVLSGGWCQNADIVEWPLFLDGWCLDFLFTINCFYMVLKASSNE